MSNDVQEKANPKMMRKKPENASHPSRIEWHLYPLQHSSLLSLPNHVEIKAKRFKKKFTGEMVATMMKVLIACENSKGL